MGSKLHTGNFVNRLKSLRDSQNWTQQELADNIEVGLKTVRNWEKEQNEPACNGMRLDNFISLCNKFECDPEYLIGDLPTPRKVNADIIAETGLTESAVESLVQIKATANSITGSAKMMLLNAMLEDVVFLENAANILYALHMIPEDSRVELSFHDKNGATNGKALIADSSDDLRRLYMADLQNIIFSFINRQFQK